MTSIIIIIVKNSNRADVLPTLFSERASKRGRVGGEDRAIDTDLAPHSGLSHTSTAYDVSVGGSPRLTIGRSPCMTGPGILI